MDSLREKYEWLYEILCVQMNISDLTPVSALTDDALIFSINNLLIMGNCTPFTSDELLMLANKIAFNRFK